MRVTELLTLRIANNNELFDFNQLNSAESIEMFEAAHKRQFPGKRISSLFNTHSDLIDSRVN